MQPLFRKKQHVPERFILLTANILPWAQQI